MRAFHNEKRAQMLRMELEHIMTNAPAVMKDAIRRVARRVPSERAVRQQAERTIGGRTMQMIRPQVFLRAEIRAAREAGQALARGDFEAAFEAKRRELYNHELYRAAVEAQDNRTRGTVVRQAAHEDRAQLQDRVGAGKEQVPGRTRGAALGECRMREAG